MTDRPRCNCGKGKTVSLFVGRDEVYMCSNCGRQLSEVPKEIQQRIDMNKYDASRGRGRFK